MRDIINIKRLTTLEEAELLDQEFAKRYGWYRQGDYVHKCLNENNTNKRVTMIAYYNDSLAGCCHLIYESQNPHFLDNNIPEINDLNVFPEYRRKHIANRLFDELELIASNTSNYIGLGVGLYRDYGNAQRMYTSRGYVMDGRGICYKNIPVKSGESVMVDDDLLIYLVKNLKSNL